MVPVTRLNGEIFFLNNALIERMEAKPDTIIYLNNTNHYIVKETPEQIINLIIQHNQKTFGNLDLIENIRKIKN